MLLLVPDKPHLLLGDDEGRGDLYTDLSANIVRALIPLSLFSHIYNRPDIAIVDRLLTKFKLNLQRLFLKLFIHMIDVFYSVKSSIRLT